MFEWIITLITAKLFDILNHLYHDRLDLKTRILTIHRVGNPRILSYKGLLKHMTKLVYLDRGPWRRGFFVGQLDAEGLLVVIIVIHYVNLLSPLSSSIPSKSSTYLRVELEFRLFTFTHKLFHILFGLNAQFN